MPYELSKGLRTLTENETSSKPGTGSPSSRHQVEAEAVRACERGWRLVHTKWSTSPHDEEQLKSNSNVQEHQEEASIFCAWQNGEVALPLTCTSLTLRMRQKLTGLINIKRYQQKHENQHHQRQKQVGMACIQLKLHHFKFSKHDHATAHCVLCAVRCHCIFYDAVSDTIRRRGGY